MGAHNHSNEHVGSNPRDHAPPRRHFLTRAHKDWRVWVVAVVLLAAITIYVMTDNLSMQPGKPVGQPVPAASVP